MGVKISELTQTTAPQNSDVLPIVQNGETKKITFANLLKNLTTQVTNLQSQINDKNIITVGISSNVTISTSGNNNINLNRTIASVGSKLTLSNGKVVIGAGVNHVFISGQGSMNLVTGNGDAKNFIIQKNGVEIIANLNTIIRQNNLNMTRGLGGFLMTVQEGDVISYKVYAGVGDAIPYTRNYITVEAID